MDGKGEVLGLQWVYEEIEETGNKEKSQGEDEDDDSDDSTCSDDSSEDDSSEDDSSEDDSSDEKSGEEKEEKKVGPSMHINMQYPKTSLKRWSTTKTSTYIDTSAPSSYSSRQRSILRKKQITLPDMANTLALSHVTSSLHWEFYVLFVPKLIP